MKKTVLFLICGTGLLLGFFTAKFLTPSPSVLQKAAATPTQMPVSQKNVITENTRLLVRYSFGGCGHVALKEEKMPASWTGKEAGTVSLPGTLFDTFEHNNLYLAKISQEKCDRHFILTAKDNQLLVTYQNDPSKVRDCYDFRPQLLSETELKKLQEGIYLESEEELTRMLEDYCS